MSHIFNTYARWDIELESGEGTKVKDIHGKEYLDFTSGIGVCNLGHCHPAIVKPVQEQLTKLWHTSNLFQSSLQEKVAKQLTEHSSGDAVFFANSGAEANEAAIKLARKYTGRSKIITFHQSFHGRTMGTIAATGQEKVKYGFGPMLESFVHIPFNDIEALKNEVNDQTAAIMLEVVQGEGGVLPAQEEYLKQIEDICEQNNILLIIDEVQTGIGRTGKPFAYQHYNLSPDIITSAKGLGNGIPVGAMIGKEKLTSAFTPGTHGTTFGGGPLAMTAANAVLKLIFNEKFLLEVIEKGNYLADKLNSCTFKGVKDIRHKGLMLGIEFSEDVTEKLATLREKGLLVLNAGPNVIRMLPPLTVTFEEMDEAVSILQKNL
ncbi:acetylornithine transaminase [Siminovitchia sediminis]|uniref:Acetylornithine aminotransferase n=1 Tax=Siminovitchia sediminis TaxID=1274353 RepID=A0ABW4KIN5_9BACI